MHFLEGFERDQRVEQRPRLRELPTRLPKADALQALFRREGDLRAQRARVLEPDDVLAPHFVEVVVAGRVRGFVKLNFRPHQPRPRDGRLRRERLGPRAAFFVGQRPVVGVQRRAEEDVLPRRDRERVIEHRAHLRQRRDGLRLAVGVAPFVGHQEHGVRGF